MITLDQLMQMCQNMLDQEEQVKRDEEKLARSKEVLRLIQEVDIPEAMEALELDELTLKDGRKLRIKQELYTSISKKNEQAAFAWLRAHGFGSIIKRDIHFKFGKGEEERAKMLIKAAEETLEEFSYTDKESIHHSTLRAFVREQLENGEEVPSELFGVFRKTLAHFED